MFSSIFLVFWCLLVITFEGTSCLSKQEYLKQRKVVINNEEKEKTGGSLSLNKDEQKVNKYLMKVKLAEFEAARQPGGTFWPSVHFFQAKEHIEESVVFKLIKKMPKGKLAHD